ncbi:beta-lactamase family protein [Streptomyces sp. RY43-2]|uniref:Beta-lactamase family protein n=1 Tax=Streptomyces macrolidinus TaxID=2952607 RepID=A0ABT0ZD89_9ACTN|nr:serine hydrolase domain-containing protein [Streptomyces macrolidinus]MCN9241543.1 beta-lactamase family protein [Streptomyces macrolidinus]
MAQARTRWRARAALTGAMAGILALPLASGTAFGAQGQPVTATVAVPPPSPHEFRSLTPAVTRQLDGAVRQVMREADVPGVIVGLRTPDRGEYVRSFGVADQHGGRRMTPDLRMRIGSETKTFTVTALLTLVDQGKVRLDDPIGTYVEGVPDGDTLTLRQLAEMRSGLFNYTDDADFRRALTSDPQQAFTPHQLLRYSFTHPVRFPPGREYAYSNTNIVLLGLVVEKVSGRPLGDYLRRAVLAPAGLSHTLFPTDAAFPAPHARGYTNQSASGKTVDAADWNPSWAWAAGAMISDLRDLRVWAATVATGELPDGTRLLSPAAQRQRLTMLATPVERVGYGLGLFDVQGWIGHNGSLPGYESLAVHLPSAHATLVVLLNTDVSRDGLQPSTRIAEAITRIVTPGHVFDLRSPRRP